MPQASEEDRALMERWFGDPVDDRGPVSLLESHGYRLTRGWEWVKPVPAHTISDIEKVCIYFLIDEWDFGGIAFDLDDVR